MKDFIKRQLLVILLSVLILELAGISGYLFFFENKHLEKENKTLSEQYLQAKKDIDAANKSIKQKDTQLEEKNKEIEGLKQTRNLTSVPTDESSASIYDKINGSDDFKSKIVAALSLMQSGDGEHFQIVTSQVGSINEYDNYGGYQEKRNIYIGADANAAITASIISHEAQHVYNVYVSRIYSYNTKEQELPCNEAELATAQRLGAPAFFITSIQNDISYWQSQ